MKSTLIVKNFGPIKEVELDLRNVNVFIGPQSTGKSALAKVYTIFKTPRKFIYKFNPENKKLTIDNVKALKDFEDVLKEYNIHSFLKSDTEIKFESELHSVSYRNGKIEYNPKLLNIISALEQLAEEFEKNKQEITEGFENLADNFIFFDIRATDILSAKDRRRILLSQGGITNLNEQNCALIFDAIKSLEGDLSTNTALYIPAERNFINIIKKSALNLILNNVPIPKHILSFGAELEKLDIKEIDLSFIQNELRYKIINGEDRIYIGYNESIMLTEAASGIQSVVPILAPILNRQNDITHYSFVIEEPELNLFPIAQYELIQLLESNRKDPFPKWEDFGNIHTYTTHSPYILSALNNLLYAYQVRLLLNSKSITNDNYQEIDEENNRIIKELVKAEINPDSFTAYQIKDGYAQSIFNRDTGLIDENYIDDASDKINEDFEALMELTR